MFSLRSLLSEFKNERHAGRVVRSFAWMAIGAVSGCSSPNWIGPVAGIPISETAPAMLALATLEPQARTNTTANAVPAKGEIHAQGKLMPARGIARISALPGDRVESVLVRAGQKVKADDPLAIMQSQKLRTLELEALELKIREANVAFQARLRELQIAIQSADAKVQAAKQFETLAATQKNQSLQSLRQVDALAEQVVRLKRLREDPLTRAAVGAIELETKQLEAEKARLQAEQAVQAAEHQIEQSKLQTTTATEAYLAAKETWEETQKNSPTLSLQKQADVLRLQLAESTLRAPYDAIVLQVLTERGERISTLPVVEIADVSKMVCIAEVYEADVPRIQVGDVANIRSSALTSELRGTVARIDRVVGAAQLRSPNPMARSDFRAIGVWIEIDPSQTEQAAERIQLQVDVTIRSNP